MVLGTTSSNRLKVIRPDWAAEIVSGACFFFFLQGLPEHGRASPAGTAADEGLDLVDKGTETRQEGVSIKGKLLTLNVVGGPTALEDGALPFKVEVAFQSYQQVPRGIN